MNPALRTITRRAIKTATLTTITLDMTAVIADDKHRLNAIIAGAILAIGYTLIHIALHPEQPHDQRRRTGPHRHSRADNKIESR